jgi:hypothetical protein
VEERTRFRFNKVCRAMALLEELQAAGLHPGAVFPLDDGTLIDLFPAEFDAAATVVAAHDVAALDAIAAAAQQQDSGDLTKVRAAYQALRSNADALRADAAAMPATLSAAQVRARLIQIEGALADVSDATASLARYVGRRLG